MEEKPVLNIVHGRNGVLRIAFLSVADEAESTAAASVSVLDDDLCEFGSAGLRCFRRGFRRGSAFGRERSQERGRGTYSFLDRAKFLELLTKSGLFGVPGKASKTSD